jgi:hypothetical protein
VVELAIRDGNRTTFSSSRFLIEKILEKAILQTVYDHPERNFRINKHELNETKI